MANLRLNQLTKRQRRQYFLTADRIALARPERTKKQWQFVSLLLAPDHVLRFQRLLRELEHLQSLPSTPINRFRRLVTYRAYRRLGVLLGFSIPPSVFGPGLSIAHVGTIVVNKGARVGANCRLHTCVNIGTAAGERHAAPTIGDNVYIGPGAKIFGPVRIANGCAIGANAVVNRSFDQPNRLIAGVPARDCGEVDTATMLIRATELLDGEPPVSQTR